ncbi:hypothetical protein BXY64_0457 [Marinifilum flexuosum]|uniref:Uncharacterized protein n=1 Tax=Marinifilum flexuosum TaxID=1117708 RepID=A0A419X6W7_9BACT|nr:hypothetical protein BXY64_0457 [Marinifilum flexuosum]
MSLLDLNHTNYLWFVISFIITFKYITNLKTLISMKKKKIDNDIKIAIILIPLLIFITIWLHSKIGDLGFLFLIAIILFIGKLRR